MIFLINLIFLQINNKKLQRISHKDLLSDASPSISNLDINYLETKYLTNIESIFLLCLIWSNLHFLSEIPQQELVKILENKLKRYRKVLSFKFETQNFGNNFFELLSQKTSLYDIFYDIINEKWVFLSEFKLSANKSISKSLNSKVLTPQEIIRLNPKAIHLKEIQTQIENDKESYVFLPHNLLYIETKHSKVSRYFLEFLITYERNFLLFSSRENGKNTIIQEILHGKIEKNEIKTIPIAYDSQLNIVEFQRIIERNYVKKGFNMINPNANNKGFLFIDDMNLANNQEKKPSVLGCLRSLIEHRGWFSRGEYVQINNTFIGGTYSFASKEEAKIYWSLEEFHLDNRFFIDFFL